MSLKIFCIRLRLCNNILFNRSSVYKVEILKIRFHTQIKVNLNQRIMRCFCEKNKTPPKNKKKQTTKTLQKKMFMSSYILNWYCTIMQNLKWNTWHKKQISLDETFVFFFPFIYAMYTSPLFEKTFPIVYSCKVFFRFSLGNNKC